MRVDLRRIARMGAVATVAALGLTLTAAPAAFASTPAGPAVFTNPSNNTPIAAPQGSETHFTVTLPVGAACPGSTAQQGYRIYSYLVPVGTDPMTLNFATGAPDQGLGYFDSAGNYYLFGGNNTGSQGEIFGIPNDFTWGTPNPGNNFQATDLTGGSSKTWDSGILCTDVNGTPVKYYSAHITFTADQSDANGFTWQPGDGAQSEIPEAPFAALLPVGAALVGGAVLFARRRRMAAAPAA